MPGLAQDGGRPLRRRLAHVRAARRHVRAAQGLPGLVLAGPVVFRLHLSQRSRLRVSTVIGPALFAHRDCGRARALGNRSGGSPTRVRPSTYKVFLGPIKPRGPMRVGRMHKNLPV